MTVPLDEVVPWGRTMDEYLRMFDLTPSDLDSKLLGCGDGPASFNAEMHRQGKRVVSLDPIYCYSAEQIESRIAAISETMLTATQRHADAFLWDEFISPEQLCRTRQAAMRQFLDDYSEQTTAGRYIAGALPNLPFADDSFDLALCSHYLFTYDDLIDQPAHIRAILEMLRVAHTVRVFPLLSMFDGGRSTHLDAVINALRNTGLIVHIRRVPYEFQRGGNEMLEVLREVD